MDRAARNAAKTQSPVENSMGQFDEMHAEQEQATHRASQTLIAAAEPESPMIGATREPSDGSFRNDFESAMRMAADEVVAQGPVNVPIPVVDLKAAEAEERQAAEAEERQARIKAKRALCRSEGQTVAMRCKTEQLSQDEVKETVKPSKAPRLLAKSEVITAAQKQEVKSEAAADRLTPGEYGALAAADHWYTVMNAETDVSTAALKQEVKVEAAVDPRLRPAEVPHHDRLEPG